MKIPTPNFKVDAITHQKIVTITVTIAILFYTYLDIRTSDSSLGNALYKGESSLGPAMINCIFLLLLIGTITKLFSKRNN